MYSKKVIRDSRFCVNRIENLIFILILVLKVVNGSSSSDFVPSSEVKNQSESFVPVTDMDQLPLESEGIVQELPPLQKTRDSRKIDQDCYSILSTGRRLVEPSVSQSLGAASEEECLKLCDEADYDCIAFSFGHLNDDDKGPSCDLLGDESDTETSPPRWSTIANPSFTIYQKHSKCPGPQGRILTGKSYQASKLFDLVEEFEALGLEPHRVQPHSAQYLADNNSPAFAGFSGGSYYQVNSIGKPVYPFPGEPVDTFDVSSTSPSIILEKAGLTLDSASPLIVRECFDLIRNGYKHSTYKISVRVSTSDQCAEECRKLTNCKTFSFRYDTTPIIINCLLSDSASTSLQLNDLVRSTSFGDSGTGVWDIFELQPEGSTSGSCRNNQPDPGRSGNECHRRDRVGYKHDYLSVRNTVTVTNLNECSRACQRTAICRSFSFRSYSDGAIRDNCFLSDMNIGRSSGLDGNDVVLDNEWEIYERVNSGRGCNDKGSGVFDEDDNGAGRIDGVCFCHRRHGYRHIGSVIRDTLTVTGLHQCALRCTALQGSEGRALAAARTNKQGLCSSFSFNSKSTKDNCILSPLSDRAILGTGDRGEVIEENDWDLFEITNSADYQSPSQGQAKPSFVCPTPSGGVGESKQETDCYRKDKTGYKHFITSVQESVSATTAAGCSAECHSRAYCRSFSYRYEYFYSSGGGGSNIPNCLLSPVQTFGFRSPQDSISDSEWDVFEITDIGSSYCKSGNGRFNGFNGVGIGSGFGNSGECFTLERSGYKLFPFRVRDVFSERDADSCSRQCQRLDYCKSFNYRRGSFNDRNNCLLSTLEVRFAEGLSDFLPDPTWDLYHQTENLNCRGSGRFGGIGSGIGLPIGGGIGGYIGSDPFLGQGSECYRRERAGSKFFAQIATNEMYARTLEDCSERCNRELYCKSFAFKQTDILGGISLGINCQFSALSVFSLTSSDISPEPNWDIYEKTPGLRCTTGGYAGPDGFGGTSGLGFSGSSSVGLYTGIGGSYPGIGGYPGGYSGGLGSGIGECYNINREGHRLYFTIVSRTLNVRDVDECSRECRRDVSCKTFAHSLSGRSYIGDNFGSGSSLGIGGAVGIGGLGASGNCQISNVAPLSLLTQDVVSEIGWRIYEKVIGGRCREDGFGGGGFYNGGFGGGYSNGIGSGIAGGRCYTRILSGYRHFSSASRDAIGVTDRDQCAERCTQTAYCQTFSYHYFLSGGLSDNCVLSPLGSTEWDSTHDLIIDTNWDIYEKSLSGSFCKGRTLDDECSERIKQNYRLRTFAVKDTRQANSVDECSIFCRRMNCRSFSFKYGSEFDNCLLSERPAEQLITAHDLDYDIGWEVHRPSSNGLRCRKEPGGIFDGGCSRKFNIDYRFEHSAVDDILDAKDEKECEELCINYSTFSCVGFAFRHSSEPYRNCELTKKEFRRSDQYDLDYAQGWNVFERTSFDGRCGGFGSHGDDYRSIDTNLGCYNRIRSDYSQVSRSGNIELNVKSLEECSQECDRLRENSESSSGCQWFAFKSGVGSTLYSNCLLSDITGRSLDADLERSNGYEVWEYNGTGDNCKSKYNSVSVGGSQCKSTRLYDGEVKYYYCRTDDKEWDYCCRPDSLCGYSQGYEFPWCYVGESGNDQWRPCHMKTSTSQIAGNRDARAGFVAEKLQEIIHKDGPPSVQKRAPDFRTLKLARKLQSSIRKRSRASSQQTSNSTDLPVRFEEPEPLVDNTESTTSVIKFGFA